MEIKIWDGVNATLRGETHFFESPAALWEGLGWDIKKNPAAAECATEITRNLFAFGFVDIPNDHGEIVHFQVVPCKD